MRGFKVISNILQLAGAAYYLYYFINLTIMLASLAGTSLIEIIFSSTLWLFLLIGLIIAINAIIGLFIKKTIPIKILSVINLGVIAGYAILVQFNFELYYAIGLAIIAFGNLLNLLFYKSNK